MGRKDLLEAFRELEAKRRDDGESPLPAPPPKAASASTPRSAPVAPPAPEPTSDRGPSSALLFRPLVQPIVLAALLLAFALGFFAGGSSVDGLWPSGNGRWSSGVVNGAGSVGPDSGGVVPQGATPAGGALRAPTGEVFETAVDRELYDRANRYTVLAITYDTNSPRNRELAAATVESFRAGGLPAARPQASGAALVVVVGAAPSQAELAALRDLVRQAPGPSGRTGEFSTAGIYAIDNLIER